MTWGCICGLFVGFSCCVCVITWRCWGIGTQEWSIAWESSWYWGWWKLEFAFLKEMAVPKWDSSWSINPDSVLSIWLGSDDFSGCVLRMTILRSNSTRPSSVLRRWLTSQYLRTSSAVRLRVFGKPRCITLISFLYWGSPRPAARIRSRDIMAILLLPANVPFKAVDFIISLILLDSCISDWDGFAGNTLRRAYTIVTGWWETALEPLCHFLGILGRSIIQRRPSPFSG